MHTKMGDDDYDCQAYALFMRMDQDSAANWEDVVAALEVRFYFTGILDSH